ncbi:MAG: hypothetical protein EON60_09625 [Alphaproteobacteria bacterium]|nr:MAG: hypothetical protein EON60_09625 [Alphaproteobacteria bacterium]
MTAHAQERAATSNLETQMTWSALSNKIATLEGTINGLIKQIEQAKLCGAAEKLYAPGASGADGKGCKAVAKTDLTQLTDIVNSTTTYNISEQKCTAQGYVYAPGKPGADKDGCLKTIAGKGCTMDQVKRCGKVGNCVVAARTWKSMKDAPYTKTVVPTKWKHGDTYLWHYASTDNDYGGGQCIDGEITYFTTGS